MRANACKGGGGVSQMRTHAFWSLKGLYKAEKMVNFELLLSAMLARWQDLDSS